MSHGTLMLSKSGWALVIGGGAEVTCGLLAQDSPIPDVGRGGVYIGIAGILTSSIPIVKMWIDDARDRRSERRADRKVDAELSRLREAAAKVAALEADRMEMMGELKALREVVARVGSEHSDAINANGEGIQVLARSIDPPAPVPSAPHLDPPVMPPPRSDP